MLNYISLSFESNLHVSCLSNFNTTNCRNNYNYKKIKIYLKINSKTIYFYFFFKANI